MFHYKYGDIDSLKKYTPIIKKLCLSLDNETEYYRNWGFLCQCIIYSNATEDEMKELDNMYNDALARESEIGLAFSLNEIGNFYGINKNYPKAQPYIAQAKKLFEKLKLWNEYITPTINYIVILKNTNKKTESKALFYHLDSLANTALLCCNPNSKSIINLFYIYSLPLYPES